MDVEARLNELERKIDTLNNLLQYNYCGIRETMWANVYHDTVRRCKWFPEDGLPCWPGREAVGYEYMYVVFRILNDLQPTDILEMGMGQSTRLLGQYIKTRDHDKQYNHYCVEHNPEWADICKKQFPLDEDRSKVVILPLTTMSFKDDAGNDKETIIYDGFYEAFKDKKFQLISIDGPYGYNDPIFARIDILEIIPQCLSEDFCILIDDYNRTGERKMANALLAKLKENGIKFETAVYEAEKQMAMVTSESWSFLRTL